MAKITPTIKAGLGYSLEKFFADWKPPQRDKLELSGLRGEVLSFQLAYNTDRHCPVEVSLSGPLAEQVIVRRIDLAHVEHPTYATAKQARDGRSPGFYPDPLIPGVPFRGYKDQTRGIWFTLPISVRAKAGDSILKILLTTDGEKVAEFSVSVKIIAATLPKQELKNFHWFHNDCIMSYHNVDAWSAGHWKIVEPYLRNAAEHGVNTMSMPVFTPPLDTAIGTERPTVQLVDIEKLGSNEYKFNFRKLKRWVDLCKKCGLTDFAITPLSTQWGAKFAPKIIAKVNGVERRIFGWHTASTSPAYKAFLFQFLPELTAFLKREKILNHVHMNVSDEPGLKHIEEYKAVRNILKAAAPEIPVLEALSNMEFYKHGLIERPAPCNNHVQPFLDAGVKPLWTYYCCAQTQDVSNRFMDFPAARNRILGWQLFKFEFEGFLHWGYNHWYKGLSSELLDPYTQADGGRLLPPGDGFVVYPGVGGPVDSMRWEVFREGLQDMRALHLLKKLAGSKPEKEIASLLALQPIKNMAQYPRTMNWLLDKRETVNQAIANLV
ncbi:MAG: DUF4091 domain-containing protein [Lentisphaerae bacterium]|nr:DUF4091 domain-containing protein [Lentisphaerota bacterium]